MNISKLVAESKVVSEIPGKVSLSIEELKEIQAQYKLMKPHEIRAFNTVTSKDSQRLRHRLAVAAKLGKHKVQISVRREVTSAGANFSVYVEKLGIGKDF